MLQRGSLRQSASNQFSHFLQAFEGKQRQDAVMSSPTALYCVCHKNTPQGGSSNNGHTVRSHRRRRRTCTAPAKITRARYVMSCTLADVSKKPAASITLSMLRDGRAGRSDSISGRIRCLYTTACRPAATGYQSPFEVGTARLLP